ncbi:MAG TPA: LysM domain-containing protein [Chthoniobacterales bacterium]|nr:LysM domain-containing protein [Chthoniobacterales bacterium]
MRLPAAAVVSLAFLMALGHSRNFAQTMAPTPNQAVSQAAQLQELTKKIEEQNAKIDMLSQEILKLELEVTNRRPGVMIGEGAPATSTSTSTTSATSAASASTPAADVAAKSGNGNNHIVARGETLTSIAKMHGVSVSDLQKFNHIDNPLKLQAGQTLLIPASPIPSPSSGE